MKTYYLDYKNFGKLIEDMGCYGDVYAPRAGSFYEKIPQDKISEIKYNPVRLADPLKSMLLPVKEKVAALNSAKEEDYVSNTLIFVGVKNCDLASLRVLDQVYTGGDCEDPFYSERRKNTIIISSDCFSPLKTCFCTKVNLKPFPNEGFDINLSKISGGFLLEVATRKGEDLFSKIAERSREPRESELAEREDNRKAVEEEVNKLNAEYSTRTPYAELVKKNFASDVWMEKAKACVSCNACNLACPTCYCFMLMDEDSMNSIDRNRAWDSCIYDRYATVAGGANPRHKVYERFRHHYFHKFDYYPEATGVLACTGCGRCIEACLGKIDKRDTIKRLEGN